MSGAGKSSLAIETLFSEGQRRYVDCFSPYARQFLARLDRPPAEELHGIPPSVVLRGTHSRYGRRARVGSVTEINDYLRLWFAQTASPVCPSCQRVIRRSNVDAIVRSLTQIDPGHRCQIGFRLLDWDAGGNWSSVRRLGFSRGLRGNRLCEVATEARQDAPFQEDDFIIVDRFQSKQVDIVRLSDSLESAFEFGRGTLYLWSESEVVANQGHVREIDGRHWHEYSFTRALRCVPCRRDFPLPERNLFSDAFGTGVCHGCEGYGNVAYYDLDKIVPDKRKSIRQGAIAPWNTPSYRHQLEELLAAAESTDLPVDVPFSELTPAHRDIVWQGSPDKHFGGLNAFFRWLERRKYKMHLRVFAARWQSYRICDVCQGKRRNETADAFQSAGYTIGQLEGLPIHELQMLLHAAHDADGEALPSVTSPLRRKLQYLCDVGLDYLTLDRPMSMLSRGEARRVLLATMLSSDLVNLLYVLEEPSLSLHHSDIQRVAQAIQMLHRRGNTVIIIDHDWRILNCAERILTLGPKAGSAGGKIVADENPCVLHPRENLNDALCRLRLAKVRTADVSQRFLVLRGANGGNLKSVDVNVPLQSLTVVCGPSGAGKSTLVERTLYRAVAKQLGQTAEPPLPYAELLGVGQLTQALWIDADPIMKSSRSNPATYVGVFDEIRRAFAQTRDAAQRGLTAASFSFNSQAGQCGKCRGTGHLQVDMHFLADAHVTCDECGGTRYRREILQIRFRDHNIHDVLQMTARDAFGFFRDARAVQYRLKPLLDVGLEYIRMGQSTSSLSAGESQRLKLASYIAETRRDPTLFVMDEPTAGLHDLDVEHLIHCFEGMLSVGHSLLVIDNRPSLLAAAGSIIEMGPGAGPNGGQIISSS